MRLFLYPYHYYRPVESRLELFVAYVHWLSVRRQASRACHTLRFRNHQDRGEEVASPVYESHSSVRSVGRGAVYWWVFGAPALQSWLSPAKSDCINRGPSLVSRAISS